MSAGASGCEKKRICVDESYPLEELLPTFPYRDVRIQKNVPVSSDYEAFPNVELGRGKFGIVNLCREKKSGIKLAVKYVDCKTATDRANMELEIEIMQKLQHPRLIQLYDAFDNENQFALVLELVNGGELFERVTGHDFYLTEKACQCFVRQIVEGAAFMHSKSIIHLDLKPENILCLTKSGNQIKIIDFGMARYYDPAKNLQILFGTPEFVAPEVVNFDPISCVTDMWSIGVICYVLLSGLSPFMGDTDVATLTNVTVGKWDFTDKIFDSVSDEAKDFIRKLLNKDTSQRLSARDALQHAWLNGLAMAAELAATKTRLKRYVIKKRWIKATNTIIALHRMGAKINFDLI